ELVGGDPDFNAQVVRKVLAGQAGPHRDIVVLNAAAGLMVADAVTTMEAGIEAATRSIDSGSAGSVLESLARESRRARDEFGE
ncbi:MAG: anthranilate phosphoribosyltransferase, partial [Actinomycetota bacterium]